MSRICCDVDCFGIFICSIWVRGFLGFQVDFAKFADFGRDLSGSLLCDCGGLIRTRVVLGKWSHGNISFAT